MSPKLPEKSLEIVRGAIRRSSFTTVARVLGVSRIALANALLGEGREATRAALAKAFLQKSSELEAL